jgi:hypothetical protein
VQVHEDVLSGDMCMRCVVCLMSVLQCVISYFCVWWRKCVCGTRIFLFFVFQCVTDCVCSTGNVCFLVSQGAGDARIRLCDMWLLLVLLYLAKSVCFKGICLYVPMSPGYTVHCSVCLCVSVSCVLAGNVCVFPCVSVSARVQCCCVCEWQIMHLCWTVSICFCLAEGCVCLGTSVCSLAGISLCLWVQLCVGVHMALCISGALVACVFACVSR